MEVDFFEMDDDDKFDEIYGTILSTKKGILVVQCAICEKNYGSFGKFVLHLVNKLNGCTASVNLLKINDGDGDLIMSDTLSNYKSESIRDPLESCASPLALMAEKSYSGTEYTDGYCCVNDDDGRKLSDESITDYINKSVTIYRQYEVDKNDNMNSAASGRYTTYDTFSCEETSHTINVSGSYELTEDELSNNSIQLTSFTIQRLNSVDESDNENGEEDNYTDNDDYALKDSELSHKFSYNKQIKCLQCTAIFTGIQEFRNHLREHISYKCSICKMGFLSQQKLDQHISKMKCESNTRPHKCKLCNFPFTNRQNLRRHMIHHLVEKRYQCEYCLKRYETSSRLHLHMRSHTNERPYKCPICGISMTNNSNMNNHIIRHSEKNKKFQCEQCPRSFFMRTELKSHVRSVHTDERPYLCSNCGMSFATQGRLTGHKNIKHHNTNDGKHKCDICSRIFCKQSSLDNHLVAHTTAEEMIHSCSNCGAVFKQRKYLLNHLKIHENKREYKCQLCGKGFNQRSALKSHFKNHHSKNL